MDAPTLPRTTATSGCPTSEIARARRRPARAPGVAACDALFDADRRDGDRAARGLAGGGRSRSLAAARLVARLLDPPPAAAATTRPTRTARTASCTASTRRAGRATREPAPRRRPARRPLPARAAQVLLAASHRGGHRETSRSPSSRSTLRPRRAPRTRRRRRSGSRCRRSIPTSTSRRRRTSPTRAACGSAPSAWPPSASRPSRPRARSATRATSARSTARSRSSTTCATPKLHEDGRELDPRFPEAIVYWYDPPRPLLLVAFMYRVHEGKEPAYARSVLPWHSHCDGWSVVMHTWFTERPAQRHRAASRRGPSSRPPSTATSATRRRTRPQAASPAATAITTA